MMKKNIKRFLATAMMSVLVTGLAGCGGNKASDNKDNVSDSEASGKSAVCYVIANTACSEGLNLDGPLVEDTVTSTIKGYGHICAVNVDADPEVVINEDYEVEDRFKKASEEKLDMDARANATELIDKMKQVKADDPETDYLKSLQLAVRTLASLEGYDSKTIIVIGTGLSTTGTLNYQNNLISAEPEAIVDSLQEKEEIPDFTDITVYWQQMGDVASPQADLTAAQRNALQKDYEAIIEAGGGECVINETTPSSVDESVEYPEVTPVELPVDTPVTFDETAYETSLEDPLEITEKEIGFEEATSNYLDPSAAKETLKPIADIIVKNNLKVLLVGCTAGDEDTEEAATLSDSRAKAVAKTLVELGCDKENINAIGMGSHDPWHVKGAGYESEAAAGNRKVVILNAESETAQNILNQSNQ